VFVLPAERAFVLAGDLERPLVLGSPQLEWRAFTMSLISSDMVRFELCISNN
jgi:hypothetical protein